MIDKRAYIVDDVGGTYLKSAVLDPDGEVMAGSASMNEAHSEGTKEDVLGALTATILDGSNYIRKINCELSGISMTFPGPFDYFKGIPLMEHKFRSIYNLNLKDIFRNISVVGKNVPLEFRHDANSVLAGELWKGNAAGYKNSAVVTLGTGLGFAFSKDGIVQCNSIGGPLITIFKIPYMDGILEDYASRRGFLKLFKEFSGKDNMEGIDVSDIGRWASEGDSLSQRVFEEVGRILADALKPILIEQKIECLLFGGQISRSFHCMEGSVEEGLKDIRSLKRISVVKSIENAPLWGAMQKLVNV